MNKYLYIIIPVTAWFIWQLCGIECAIISLLSAITIELLEIERKIK